MHADDLHLKRALRAGARGYLIKDAEPEAIVRSIAAVHSGQVIFSPDVGVQLIAAGIAIGGAARPSRPSRPASARSWTGWRGVNATT